MALVVDHAGASLEKGTHETVVLTYADGRRERVGLRALGSVVLHGDVKLSSGLLLALAAHNIAFTTIPARGVTPAVELAGMPRCRIDLRHQQHLAYADTDDRRLDLARQVVLAKLAVMAEQAHCRAPEREGDFYRSMQMATKAADLSELMGVEGAATVKHFALLEALFQRTGAFRFEGRSRRPPRDPVNAMMSLSYTLAEGQAAQLALKAGLDVQLGFLHALHHDRESLALDLIEPARPTLDDWIYELLSRRGLLKPGQFTSSEDEGVRLSPEGRAIFYPLWFREGHRLALEPMHRLLASLLKRLRDLNAGDDCAHGSALPSGAD